MGPEDPAGQKLPAGQGPVQLALVSESADPNRPAGHCTGAAEPETQNEPVEHGVSQMEPRPNTSLKNPAAHSLHSEAFPRLKSPRPHCTAVGITEPAGQACPGAQGPVHKGVTNPTPEPYRPALQLPLQLADDIAAVAPYRPAAHADVHAAVVRPVVFPNRPAGQSTHTPAPDKLYRPTPHTAAVGVVDRATQKYPAVQFPLHVALVSPATPPNTPAGHSTHTPAPDKLY